MYAKLLLPSLCGVIIVCASDHGNPQDKIAQLIKAVRTGETTTVRRIVKDLPAAPDIFDAQGCSLLHYCIPGFVPGRTDYSKAWAVAEVLLDAGAGVHYKKYYACTDSSGCIAYISRKSPLECLLLVMDVHEAYVNGQHETVTRLCEELDLPGTFTDTSCAYNNILLTLFLDSPTCPKQIRKHARARACPDKALKEFVAQKRAEEKERRERKNNRHVHIISYN